MDDHHEWSILDSTDVIENVCLYAKASYKYIDPDALGPTLNVLAELSSLNLILSDYLVLSVIELLFAIQDTYNNHEDSTVGDSQIEEVKMEEKFQYKAEDLEIDASTEAPDIEYVELKPHKSKEIDPDKLEKWEAHVKQHLKCTFAGMNITISEHDAETKKSIDIIFCCIQALNVDCIIMNTGMSVVSSIKRLYVQDLLLTSRDQKCKTDNPMPDIFGMLICNPLLERHILEHNEAKGDERDVKLLDENYDIRESLQQLIVNLHRSKTETNIEFTFNNFRLLLNERTIEKIFEFIFKIGRNIASQDDKLSKIKQELNRYKQSLDPDAPDNAEGTQIEIKNTNDERSLFKNLSKIRQDYLVKQKHMTKIKLEKLEEKQRINISGTINNVEVWIPLDWTVGDAKFMSVTLSSDIKHSSYTHKIYYVNDLTNWIFKVDNVRNVDDSKVSIKGLKVKIEHILEGDSSISQTALAKSITNEFIRSTLLKCPRIELSYEKESRFEEPKEAKGDDNLKNKAGRNVTDGCLILQLSPINVNVGFVEIHEFKVVYKRGMEIVNSIMKQNQNILDKLTEDYQDSKQTVSEIVGSYFSSMIDSNVASGRKTKVIKSKLAKKKQINMIRVIFTVEYLQASLVDDLGLYHQPLIILTCNSLRCTLDMEDGKESAKSFILRKLAKYEDPYIDLQLSVDLAADYYNYESCTSEPLIEPWGFELNCHKTSPGDFDIEGRYALTSSHPLNLNLTYGMAVVTKKVIDNLFKDEIVAENAKKEEKDHDKLDTNEEYYEFVNNLGCDLTLSVEDVLSLSMDRAASYKRQDINGEDAVIDLPAGGKPITRVKHKLIEISQKVGVMKRRVSTMYDQALLRMDVAIEDMEMVKAVPVELTGVRSYPLKSLEDSTEKHMQNLSFIVNVKAKSHGQILEVSFDSPIVFANNCEFPISISCIQEQHLKKAKEKNETEKIKVDANKVFVVPLPWIIGNVCLLYEKAKNKYKTNELLLYTIGSTMLVENSEKVSIPFKSQFFTHSRMDENRTTFSLDVYAFQCKPHKNKSPLQILISCNPPI